MNWRTAHKRRGRKEARQSLRNPAWFVQMLFQMSGVKRKHLDIESFSKLRRYLNANAAI